MIDHNIKKPVLGVKSLIVNESRNISDLFNWINPTYRHVIYTFRVRISIVISIDIGRLKKFFSGGEGGVENILKEHFLLDDFRTRKKELNGIETDPFCQNPFSISMLMNSV